MTLVNIDLRNQGYETGPDDRVVFYSLLVREGDFGTISTAPVEVELVDGKATVDLAPGPVGVQIIARQVADTRIKIGEVPPSGPTTLNAVMMVTPAYTPALQKMMIAAIERAKEIAVGQVDGAVSMAIDAEVGEAIYTATSSAVSAANSAITAQQFASSADARAASAEDKADNVDARMDAIEVMGGLAPGEPVDGQTANLITQPETLTRRAVSAAIAETAGVISVGDYGAIPDGTTDNTGAFNAAMAAARSEGRKVYVPAGRWKIEGTVDISGVQISGEISGYQNTSGAIIVGNGTNTALKQMSYQLPYLTMSVSGLRIENVETGLDLGYMVQTTVEDVWVHSSGTGIKFGTNSAVGPLWCMFKRVIADSSGGHGMVMQGSQWCNANSFDTCEFKGAAGFAGVQIDTTGGYGAVKNSFKNCEFAGDGAGILLSGTTRSTTVADCYMESKGPSIVSRGLTIDLHMSANVYGSTGNDTVFAPRFIDHEAGNMRVIVDGGWIVTGTDARQEGVHFVGSKSPSTLELSYTHRPHASTSSAGFMLHDPAIISTSRVAISPTHPQVQVRRTGDVVRFRSSASVIDTAISSWTLPDWARPSVSFGGRPINADGELYVGADGKITLTGLGGKTFRFDLTYLI
ncbi:glycosyl hydrolase family 28-related protein [uncultured Corynebacterium sp.]|uniref:glycosyl hydrolase family 28-related protein n=1 Tax=uncultured Corynebacterium sp. TaxID=159447 RepID=UPI0025CD9FA3|nr:glycosyl hydrolase family 28-related protein [uncultured Corynebacterium sp.]